MSRPPKRKVSRRGKSAVIFYAPTPLVAAYRQSINGQTMSQDLRRYMAERVEAEGKAAA